jgi:hypothetical protein
MERRMSPAEKGVPGGRCQEVILPEVMVGLREGIVKLVGRWSLGVVWRVRRVKNWRVSWRGKLCIGGIAVVVAVVVVMVGAIEVYDGMGEKRNGEEGKEKKKNVYGELVRVWFGSPHRNGPG